MPNSLCCKPQTERNKALVDFQLEAEVLSSIIKSGESEKLEKLRLRDFVFPETKAIYRILRRMRKTREPIDSTGVLRHCEEEGMNPETVMKVLMASPTETLFSHQLYRLRELSNKRQACKLAKKLSQNKITLEKFQSLVQKLSVPSVETFEIKELLQSPQVDEKLEIDWVVPELIPRGYLTWLVGYPKTGKSWLALRLACDASAGGEVFDGFCATKPKRVLYILGDTDKRQPLYRLSKTKWRFERENLKFVYLNELEKKGLDLDLSTDEGKKLFEALLENYKPDLVIVDSLSSFVSYELTEERRAKPIAIYCNQVAQRLNIGLLVLHHSRKPKKELENMRISQHDVSGSGVLTRFSAITIGVELREDKKTSQKKHLVRFLGGWFPEFPSFSFWLEDKVDEETEKERAVMLFDHNPEGKNLKEMVLSTIRSKFPGREFTREELLAELPREISTDWLKKILTNLVKQNVISKMGNTRNTKYFFSREGKILYPNTPETALHKEKNLGSDWSIPSKKYPNSSDEYPNEYPNSKPLVERFSRQLGYSEKQYSNEYSNCKPLVERPTDELEHSNAHYKQKKFKPEPDNLLSPTYNFSQRRKHKGGVI